MWASSNTRVQRTRSSASPPHSPLTRRPLGAAVKCWRRAALATDANGRATIISARPAACGDSASGRAERLRHEGAFGKPVVESWKSPFGSSRPAAALRCNQRRGSRGSGFSASSEVRA